MLTEQFCEEVIRLYNYEEQNILKISNELSCEIFMIPTVLFNHGLVQKRTDSRGYAEYMKSDEYLKKCKK